MQKGAENVNKKSVAAYLDIEINLIGMTWRSPKEKHTSLNTKQETVS